MHCSVDIDDRTRIDLASINTGLDRAKERGEVVEIFTHTPGVTVSMAKIEGVLAGAVERGLTFYSYTDLAGDPPQGPGIAFSFDDWHVTQWLEMRPLLMQYNAKLTFFVAKYADLQDSERAGIAQLAADGHDIEAHSAEHMRAADYVEERGLDSYVQDEADPSITRLIADGYTISTYAYPFGSRTDEIDNAMFKRVKQLRGITWTWSGVSDPCPF